MNPEEQIVQEPEITPVTLNEEKFSVEEQRKMTGKYKNRFQASKAAVNELHKLWRIIDFFDRGRQWESGGKLPPWIPKPVTNMIRYVRTMKRANLGQRIGSGHLTPKTPMDEPLTNLLQRAVDHVWQEEKIPKIVRRSIDRSILHGTVISYVYAEENIRGKYYGENHEGNQLYTYDVKVKRIQQGNFYPDAKAYNIEECGHATITENLFFTDVKNNPTYKRYAGKRLKDLTYADISNEGSGDIFDRDNKVGNLSLGGEKEDEKCTVFIHWERYRNNEGKWQVDVTHYLENTDFFLYRITDFKPSELPFAVLYDEEEDNSFWGTGGAMDILENQKIINKVDQVTSIIGTLHQNPQKVISRESGINAKEMAVTGNQSGKVWVTNGDPQHSVHYLTPPDIPKPLLEISAQTKADIKDMAGITEAYTGQSVGSLTTSSGVDTLVGRATVRDQDKSTQIDDYVERLTDLVAKFIIVFWKEERPLMTRKQNGDPEFEVWKPVNDMVADNLEWRVVSNVYAKAPMTQQSLAQQADNIMTIQGNMKFDPPLITPEEWIQMKDFHNKEDILARIQADRKVKQQQNFQQLETDILNVIGLNDQLQSQGLSPDNVKQQLQPQIQQIAEKIFTSGTGQNQPSSPSTQPQANAAANANMIRG